MKGPRWIKQWISDLALLNEQFRDENGTIDFEALGREEYQFRIALITKRFEKSQRAKEIYSLAKKAYDSSVENGKKGGRPSNTAPQESAPALGQYDQVAGNPLSGSAAPAAKTQQSFPRALGRAGAPDTVKIGQTFTQDGPTGNGGLNVTTPQGYDLESRTSCEHLSRQVVDRITCRPVELDGTADAGNREAPENFVSRHERGALLEAPQSAEPIEPKDAYGDNKTVLLTLEEGAKLREVYGEDLEMAIDILDAYLVNGGTKGKKYKSHYAVMKKGSWVWNRVQESKVAEKRLEKAESTVDRRTPYQKNQDDLLQLVKMTERSLKAI